MCESGFSGFKDFQDRGYAVEHSMPVGTRNELRYYEPKRTAPIIVFRVDPDQGVNRILQVFFPLPLTGAVLQRLYG